MQKIKRVLAVTTIQKPGEKERYLVGNFNLKQYIKEGYSISAPALYEVECSLDKFFEAADTKKLVTPKEDMDTKKKETEEIKEVTE